jgi:zinc transport system substrate-binding protein
MPLEDAWLPRLRATNARMQVLDARDGIRLLPQEAVQEVDDHPDTPAEHEPADHDHHDHHDHRDHEGLDPHVWTSPPLVKAMGAHLRDALIALRPGQAATFSANYARLAAELDALDAEIRARLAPVKDRRFMVFHPGWGYFADTYGLTQLAIEYEGKEPGAHALTALIEAARADGVKLVLVQPQFSPRAAQQVAAAIGGRVESVDNLSPDYFGALRRITGLIAGP